MKNIIILALVFQSWIVFGQESYVFTTFPKENIKYKAKKEMITDSYTEIYELKKKRKKLINSTHLGTISKFRYEITNGNRKDNKVEYTRKTTNFVYEKIKNGEKEVIDYPLDSDEHTQKNWIDNVFGLVGIHQFKFPETPMKIGDTIVHNVEGKIPFLDGVACMYKKDIFTLTEVKDNVAYFDIETKIEYESSSSIIFENVKSEIGKLEYDFVNNIVKRDKSSVLIEFIGFDEGVMIKHKFAMTEDYQTID